MTKLDDIGRRIERKYGKKEVNKKEIVLKAERGGRTSKLERELKKLEIDVIEEEEEEKPEVFLKEKNIESLMKKFRENAYMDEVTDKLAINIDDIERILRGKNG